MSQPILGPPMKVDVNRSTGHSSLALGWTKVKADASYSVRKRQKDKEVYLLQELMVWFIVIIVATSV